ncbi:MAG: sulfatase-like hydrolase/transferase [Planctomycetota bacterium]|jgi:arylsulfatase A
MTDGQSRTRGVVRASSNVLVALVCAGGLALTARAAGKPNIVMIMADDMGYECMGANGSTFYKTPNLDRLAAGGMRFEHCYSQPICTPSRVQIMTGRYNSRNYVKFGLLHQKEITFGNVMKRAGYATCVAGKWQLQGGFEGPNKFGFDEYCLWQLTRRPCRYPNPGLEVNGKQVDYTNGEYGPDIVSDFLIDFIKRHRDGPFFVYYPMILPHWPFQPTPDSKDWDPSEKKEWPRSKWDRPHFSDMVSYTDKMVGKIDRALAEFGIREKTLLIFTCDNGTYTGITSPFKGRDYKGGKGSTPNAGTHVPMVASWPGTIKRGVVSQDLIDFSDMLVTFADLGGGQVPTDRKIDGRSFAPQLRGERGNPRDWVFCWYERNGKRSGKVKRFARNQVYKLYHDGRFYNIPADELEKKQLSPNQIDTSAREVQARLKAVIDEIYGDEKDFPYAKGASSGKKKKNK